MINEDLRIFRHYCGFTQAEVAEAVGIDRKTYAAYESGASKPKDDVIESLALLFNISEDRLRTGFKNVLRFNLYQPPAANMYDFEDDLEQEYVIVANLTEEERRVVRMFRVCPDRDKFWDILRDTFYD